LNVSTDGMKKKVGIRLLTAAATLGSGLMWFRGVGLR